MSFEGTSGNSFFKLSGLLNPTWQKQFCIVLAETFSQETLIMLIASKIEILNILTFLVSKCEINFVTELVL